MQDPPKNVESNLGHGAPSKKGVFLGSALSRTPPPSPLPLLRIGVLQGHLPLGVPNLQKPQALGPTGSNLSVENPQIGGYVGHKNQQVFTCCMDWPNSAFATQMVFPTSMHKGNQYFTFSLDALQGMEGMNVKSGHRSALV